MSVGLVFVTLLAIFRNVVSNAGNIDIRVLPTLFLNISINSTM